LPQIKGKPLMTKWLVVVAAVVPVCLGGGGLGGRTALGALTATKM